MSKVLIVDDAYSMRNLIKKHLREAGYEVVGEAKNGTEGLRMYRELLPDFVTMDIKMPDISGIDVTRQILQEYPNAKIIAITGNNDEQIKKEIMKAGAKDYLKKPFQPAFLLTKVEKMLQEGEPDALVVKKAKLDIETDLKLPVNDGIEDFFEEDMEFDLEDKPDDKKMAVIVLENEEDVIEFPEDYPKEEEEQQHAFTLENIIEPPEEEIEIHIELNPTSPASRLEEISSHHPSTNTNFSESPTPPSAQKKPPEQEVSLFNASSLHPIRSSHNMTTSLEKEINVSSNEPLSEQEIISPIQIRPPRNIRKERTPSYRYEEEDVDLDADEEFEFNVNSPTEGTTTNSENKKGFVGFIKSLFTK